MASNSPNHTHLLYPSSIKEPSIIRQTSGEVGDWRFLVEGGHVQETCNTFSSRLWLILILEVNFKTLRQKTIADGKLDHKLSCHSIYEILASKVEMKDLIASWLKSRDWSLEEIRTEPLEAPNFGFDHLRWQTKTSKNNIFFNWTLFLTKFVGMNFTESLLSVVKALSKLKML